MIQLEYWLDGEWLEVVRYDHDRDALGGHDVSVYGLHLDVYRDGEKYRTEQVSKPIPANDAFDYAEDDLSRYHQTIRTEIRAMARSDRTGRPVSEAELEEMPARIGEHFDRVRELLEEAVSSVED